MKQKETMRNLAKDANYPTLLQTIAELVQEVKNREFELEDPYGEDKKFKVQNMSIAILSQVEKYYLIHNKAINDKGTDTNKTMLVRIWISNKHKTYEIQKGFPNVTLDPENFRVTFEQEVYNWINEAYRGFFGSPKEESKKYKRSKDEVEEYMETISIKKDLSPATVKNALKITQKIHEEIDEVRDVMTTLSYRFKVFLIADSEGRKILTKNNEFFSMDTKIKFINKQNYEIVKDAMVYAMTEKSLRASIPSFLELNQGIVKEHEQIHFLESGFYPILMAPEATHTLFHEGIAGHNLSAKYIVEEESSVLKMLGKDLAKDRKFKILNQITIENKPNLEDTIASYKYDHEGIRAQDSILLDKGKIKNYLKHRNSAFNLGQRSNGTALAAAFTEKQNDENFIVIPEPRISNLIITSHSNKTIKTLREEMIKYCNRHKLDFYLEVSSKEGQVFVDSGNFELKINDCNMVSIHDGSKKKVWGGMLSGKIFEFISATKAFSLETEEDEGVCGSESGFVPIYGKAPYMIIEKFSFVNTKKPQKKNLRLNPKYKTKKDW